MTLWTIVRQAPLSVGFSKHEYWSGLPCPSPGDLPNPGIKLASLMSPALPGRFFTISATWEALSLLFPPPTSHLHVLPHSPGWRIISVCCSQSLSLALTSATLALRWTVSVVTTCTGRRRAGGCAFCWVLQKGSVCVVTEEKKKAKNLRHSLCLLIPEKKRKKKHSLP